MTGLMIGIERLLAIMARLRDPETGCPWDRAQSFATIAPYTIEEAYEVAEAIAAGDLDALRDELGDLLFQVVFHAQMAREGGAFDFDAVVAAICEKMVRRHPHLFADAEIDGADAQTRAWEALKADERAAKTPPDCPPSALDGIALALPALSRAQKLQTRAARVGFDWQRVAPVLAKVEEELGEVRAVLEGAAGKQRLAEEIGDLLFACVNVARHVGIDAETALRDANAKFARRFRRIEALLAERGRTAEQSSLDEMGRLWDRAKAEERR